MTDKPPLHFYHLGKKFCFAWRRSSDGQWATDTGEVKRFHVQIHKPEPNVPGVHLIIGPICLFFGVWINTTLTANPR